MASEFEHYIHHKTKLEVALTLSLTITLTLRTLDTSALVWWV